MQLVFIHGPPAVGKLTVALRLGQATGYPVLHNHLVVDLVQAVFDFGSAPFVGLREAIWLQVVERAAQEGRAGLISTFTPEQTVSSDFIDALVVAVGNAGARALFVQLTCPEGELERRMENESRAEFGKLRSRESYRRLRDGGAFVFPPLPDSGLTIDTSKTDPDAAAQRIISRFGLPTIF